MRKYVLSGLLILAFLGYCLHYQSRSYQPENPANIISLPQSSRSTPAFSQSWHDGTYTGSVADAFYGNVQVQATIKNGQITNVAFLQSPNDRSTSIMINRQAMPLLRQEALQNQNAQVDIISGATQTSEAFRQSLQSALNQAQ